MSNIFVVAEAGVNMNGRLDHALALVAAAKTAGADAVKFQAFTPLRLAPLDYKTQAMLKGLALTESELTILAAECFAKQIEFMVTPMDEGWLDFVVGLGVKRIKVGSGQNRDIGFLKYVGDICMTKNLPVIISNGMATPEEFRRAVHCVTPSPDVELTILSCVSKYPTPDVDMSLDDMRQLRANYHHCDIGFSSHCRSFWPSVAAAYAGATVIEAHICLPGTTGPDISSSLLPEEFAAMVREVRGVPGPTRG